MTKSATSAAARTAAKAVLALGTLVLCATAAGAVSMRVQMACASDYYAYCSQHDPDGPGVRQCMRANGLKLSKSCVNALISAGEVSKEEVARRAASGNRSVD
ncbi:MAG TPA: hypothetical protein VJ740_12855 [Hyphomicrobiaceae bacterium]|jgi:hypothetical protein|nr:hypothetical protein [Hyphomicrobiaceae bacterium]